MTMTMQRDPLFLLAQQLRQRVATHESRPQSAVDLSNRAGIVPDPWQARVLTTTAKRVILLCSRQSGKSTTAATRAMWRAISRSRGLVIMGAPTQNQASELLTKARAVYNVTAPPVDDHRTATDRFALHDAVTRMKLPNRSRIIATSGNADTVRGYTVDELIVDEAAYVPDAFYQAVMPMLAVSGGNVLLMSTPNAKVGAFYDIWTEAPEWDDALPADEQPNAWLKIRVPWRECPRIPEHHVADYRERWGEEAYLREFECEFLDAIGAVFRQQDIDAMSGSAETWSLW